MNETRTKVTIDDSGIDSFFQRIKRSADELGREMIQASRRYSTSSREVLRDIEEQIRAIERRNRLDAEFQKTRLTRLYESGAISQEQFRERAAEIRKGTEEDKIQIALLREMIETIKQTAKEEIREDRKAVEEQIKHSKTVDQLAPEGDEKKILKETIQRGLLGEVGEGEQEDRKKFQDYLTGGGNLANKALSIGASKNEIYAAAAMVALMPIVGQGLSMIATKLLSSAEAFENSRERLYGVMGVGAFNSSEYGGLTKAGYSSADEMAARADYLRRNFRQGYVSELYAERGLGLGRQELGALATTQRGTEQQAGNVANLLAGTLIHLNKNEEETRAYLGEYLSILVDVNKEQLNTIGSVDSVINTKVIASLTQLGKEYRNPEFLRGVIMSVRQGLTQAQTPQIEALQYAVLSRINPGASLWELQKMMENPFGKESQKYLPEFLKSLISISGSKEDAYFNVKAAFGVSNKVAEDLVNNAYKLKTSDQIASVAGFDLEQEAFKATGNLKSATASTDNFFQQNGEKLVNFVSKGIDILEKFFEHIGGTKDKPLYTIVTNPETGKLEVTNAHKLDNAQFDLYLKALNENNEIIKKYFKTPPAENTVK